MEIIPVIDVMRGKVVHASAGNRSHYSSLKSILTTSDHPIQVIKDVLAYHPFSKVYIADLDAIVDDKINEDLYCQLAEKFPQISIWLDAGIRTKERWLRLVTFSNFFPVLGSETLRDIYWLQDPFVRKRSIMSLDFKLGQFLGDKALLSQPDYWTEYIIAMNLDCIGSSVGPDIALLETLKNSTSSEVIAAGGVRDRDDLRRLDLHGIERVLVASALHNGKLTKDCFST